ncbi:pilus assembly PilX family protein [Stutzerimonas stutzeri]|uniref:pilus assembly PilX family protein n=1 Tax=Stutzerimonas stutzeri TaxID=316 RepID=UPI003D316471
MKHSQQGTVLLVSLLLLLMLTIIAITAASQSNLQLRIASNSQQQNIAFQAAESGLQRWANVYFSRSDADPNLVGRLTPDAPEEQLAGAAYEVSPTLASNLPLSEGMGISEPGLLVYRFEVRSVGRACDNEGNCGADTAHRQGFQNRSFSTSN